MKKKYFIFASCILVMAAVFSANLMHRGVAPSFLGINAQTVTNSEASITSRLRNERIVQINRWNIGDDVDESLLVMVQAFDESPHYEGSGERLFIANNAGTTIYEDHFRGVSRIYSTGALRHEANYRPQLVVEVNDGGSDHFLLMLDYRDGRVTNLTEDIENSFHIGAEVRPQLRSGARPDQRPLQIMLTKSSAGFVFAEDKNTCMRISS